MEQLFAKMALANWNSSLANTDKLLNELTDEQLQGDVSEGRNSGVYLLGHLVAVHDRMLPLLGLGEAKYGHYFEPFLANGDKTGKEFPPVSELRAAWAETNTRLNDAFNTQQPADWFGRHTSVTEEDFAKEPHRNKLNVLMSRTMHLVGHHGQMVFLKKK